MRKSYSNYIYQLSYEAQCISFLSVILLLTILVLQPVRFSKTASINQFLDCKGKECWFKTKRFGHEASACICYKNTVALL
jgi:hypothetical protein